jgi:hypothetical protein
MPIRAGDLTSLEKAKAYLRIDTTNTASDTDLQNLIAGYSRIFQSTTRRRLLFQSYTNEIRDGQGTVGIEPFEYPVVDVQAVVVDGVSIPKQPTTVPGDPPQYGWAVATDRIQIVRGGSLTSVLADYVPYDGYFGGTPFTFRRGFGNVSLTYRAGFYMPAEAATVPANPGPYTVQTVESFVSDQGVKYASSGIALAKVTGVPALGQYSVSATGLYTFAAADQGVAVLLSYAYVPGDIEQAVIEMVGFSFRGRDRLGQQSKNTGNEVIVFHPGPWPMVVQNVIDRRARVGI